MGITDPCVTVSEATFVPRFFLDPHESFTSSAAKPLGSVGPQCQARTEGSDAANALLSNHPAPAAICSRSRRDASSRITRSAGR